VGFIEGFEDGKVDGHCVIVVGCIDGKSLGINDG
jgi:hypothetical protein